MTLEGYQITLHCDVMIKKTLDTRISTLWNVEYSFRFFGGKKKKSGHNGHQLQLISFQVQPWRLTQPQSRLSQELEE